MKTLLHFTAKWCKPCRELRPIIEEYLSSHEDIVWDMVDVDLDFPFTKMHNVLSVPTLILMIDGKEAKRHVGVATKQEIADFLS